MSEQTSTSRLQKVLRLFAAICAVLLLFATTAVAIPPGNGNGNGNGNGDHYGNEEPENEVDPDEEAAKEEALKNLNKDNNTLAGESTQETATLADVSNDCDGMLDRVTRLVENEHKKFGEYHCQKTESCTYECKYKRKWSCFPADTQIQMADGSTKAVSEVQSGDLVWNPARQKAMRVGNTLAGPEDKPLVKISYGTKSVTVTQTHPMVLQNRAGQAGGFQPAALRSLDRSKAMPNASVKKAQEVTLNDWILGEDGEFHQVTQVEELPLVAGQVVYNFELDTDSSDLADHMIVADGVITGDVTVQADLNNYKLPWQE